MPVDDAMVPTQLDSRMQPKSSRRRYRVWFWSVLGFVLCTAVGAVQQPAPPSGDTVAPLDEPLRLIAEARQVMREIGDYSCVLIKRERIGGQMMPENVIALKVRARPFSVYMRWQDPQEQDGQEACFVAGKNGNKMRVHPNGGLALLGWVTLDQRDPRALKTTRHAIAEAGLSNLIERYAAAWGAERSLGQTQVQLAEYEYNKRCCTRVEVAHPARTLGQYEYFRTVIYFDRETKLPIRVECYDYPRRADDPGELIEVYSYINLRCNVGLGDETFNH